MSEPFCGNAPLLCSFSHQLAVGADILNVLIKFDFETTLTK
jgi:hypothetical protein